MLKVDNEMQCDVLQKWKENVTENKCEEPEWLKHFLGHPGLDQK